MPLYPPTGLLPANNLSDVAVAATAFSNIKQNASETATGVVEQATQTEVNTGTDTSRFIVPATLHAKPGQVMQVVSTQTGAVATGTTVLPYDDTIPQNTEGIEFMTLAITPKNTNNILIIDVVYMATNSAAVAISAALFQDTTADALAAIMLYPGGAGNQSSNSFRHKMTAGTTSSTTFKVRIGGSGAGTTTFNGDTGARKFGGVMASSITIVEVVP